MLISLRTNQIQEAADTGQVGISVVATLVWRHERLRNRRLQAHPINEIRPEFSVFSCLNRGADKSLARPGRKQATVTKLLLLQATQKQFRKLSVQPGLRGSNDLRVGRKMATFELFFSLSSG